MFGILQATFQNLVRKCMNVLLRSYEHDVCNGGCNREDDQYDDRSDVATVKAILSVTDAWIAGGICGLDDRGGEGGCE